ncbi:hypothetical protein BGZ93_009765 [Podila epicladia]|nr:hypothetical protein BGZ93_009765 [Podila epicladia]
MPPSLTSVTFTVFSTTTSLPSSVYTYLFITVPPPHHFLFTPMTFPLPYSEHENHLPHQHSRRHFPGLGRQANNFLSSHKVDYKVRGEFIIFSGASFSVNSGYSGGNLAKILGIKRSGLSKSFR